MSMYNVPPQLLNRAGIQTAPPSSFLDVPAPRELVTPTADQAERGMLRSGLLDLFPQEVSRPAYFAEISVPANIATLVANTTHAAWFVFQRFAIPDNLPECAYIGADIQLSPADVDAAVAPSAGAAGAWGDLAGTTAWIVIDINTGLEFQQWGGRPAFLPGVGSNAYNLVSPRSNRQYAGKIAIPPGKFTSTNPSKIYLGTRYLPALQRLVKSADTMDVCLVIPRAQAVAAASKVLCGSVDLNLWFLPDSGPRAFSTT